MNGADSLVKTMLACDLDVCFANPGTSEMHFVAALDKIAGMRCVLGLFEGVVTGGCDPPVIRLHMRIHADMPEPGLKKILFPFDQAATPRMRPVENMAGFDIAGFDRVDDRDGECNGDARAEAARLCEVGARPLDRRLAVRAAAPAGAPSAGTGAVCAVWRSCGAGPDRGVIDDARSRGSDGRADQQ